MRPTLSPWEEGGQRLAPTVDAYPQEGIRGGGSAPIHSSPLTEGPWEEGAADCPRLGVDLRTMDGAAGDESGMSSTVVSLMRGRRRAGKESSNAKCLKSLLNLNSTTKDNVTLSDGR